MNDKLCPAPWLSVYVDPTGRIDNCCVAKNNIGNVAHTQDLKKTVTEGNNLSVQKQMLSGQRVDGCVWCYDREHSLQQMFWGKFPNRDDTLYARSGQFDLRYLDLRWRNLCNYACIYCTPELSSSWAHELGRPIEIETAARRNLQQHILENLQSVQEVYLAGGEPLLMKEHEPLLERLLDINPQCIITVNTNLSNIKNNRIFDLLTQFPRCTWMLSVEDQEDRYEYIRYPGQWSVFADNLGRLTDRVGHELVHFHMVYMNVNAVSIWNLVDNVVQSGYNTSNITVTLYNNGNTPGPWDVRHLARSEREAAQSRMIQDQYAAIQGWSTVRDYLSNIKTNGDHALIIEELLRLDQRRGLDSRKIFPQIYQVHT